MVFEKAKGLLKKSEQAPNPQIFRNSLLLKVGLGLSILLLFPSLMILFWSSTDIQKTMTTDPWQYLLLVTCAKTMFKATDGKT